MGERIIDIAYLPPIVQAAILAIIRHEDYIDMGYDICYYQEDLPNVVKRAIEPWSSYCNE